LFFVEIKWHGPGSSWDSHQAERAFRPFYFRGCDLREEYLPAKEELRAQFPAAAPLIHRLSVSTRLSLQNSAGGRVQTPSGSTEAALPFSGVVADKQWLALGALEIRFEIRVS
jgi:hypothetical protein